MENKKMYETRRLQFSERRRFLFDKTIANYCLTNEPVQYGTPDVIEAYANAKRITNALVDSLSLSSFLKFEDDITVDSKYSDMLTYLVSE